MWGKLRTKLVAAVLAGGGVFALMPAQPAAAALGHCNTTSSWLLMARPSVASTGALDCVMGQGSNSSAVRALQATLRVCFGKNIAVDSDFGPNTRAALVSVQQSLRISADGVYGPQSFGAMARSNGWISGNYSFCVLLT